MVIADLPDDTSVSVAATPAACFVVNATPSKMSSPSTATDGSTALAECSCNNPHQRDRCRQHSAPMHTVWAMSDTHNEEPDDLSCRRAVADETKACPWCAETILAAAKKCKHCGELLTGEKTGIAMTVPKAAAWFGMSKRSMYRAVREGGMPAKTINGTLWVSRAQVARWLEAGDNDA
jgi:hypothetical protein